MSSNTMPRRNAMLRSTQQQKTARTLFIEQNHEKLVAEAAREAMMQSMMDKMSSLHSPSHSPSSSPTPTPRDERRRCFHGSARHVLFNASDARRWGTRTADSDSDSDY